MPRQTKVLYAFFAVVSALLFFSEPQTTEVTPDSRCSEGALDAVLDGGLLILPESCFIITSDTKVITGDVVIYGEGFGVNISGAGQHRVFEVLPNASLRLENIFVRRGFVTDRKGGAGIYNAGQLSLIDTNISQNRADQSRGAGVVNATDALLIMRNSQIHHNVAFGGLGAGLVNQGYAAIMDSGLFHNTVETIECDQERQWGFAGGLFNDGVMWISDSRIDDNSAGTNGGIMNNGELILTHSRVTGNHTRNTVGCSGDNAGILNSQFGTMVISNSTISHNQSGKFAGGIANVGSMQVIDSRITHNTAYSGGAGIINVLIDSENELIVENSIISNNRVTYGSVGYREGLLVLNFAEVQPTAFNLQHNYWGSDDGPGGMGPGYGDGIAGWDFEFNPEVFTPWLRQVPDWARR